VSVFLREVGVARVRTRYEDAGIEHEGSLRVIQPCDGGGSQFQHACTDGEEGVVQHRGEVGVRSTGESCDTEFSSVDDDERAVRERGLKIGRSDKPTGDKTTSRTMQANTRPEG
jgi:hypothetical protein